MVHHKNPYNIFAKLKAHIMTIGRERINDGLLQTQPHTIMGLYSRVKIHLLIITILTILTLKQKTQFHKPLSLSLSLEDIQNQKPNSTINNKSLSLSLSVAYQSFNLSLSLSLK
jgi:hypothetical protein